MWKLHKVTDWSQVLTILGIVLQSVNKNIYSFTISCKNRGNTISNFSKANLGHFSHFYLWNTLFEENAKRKNKEERENVNFTLSVSKKPCILKDLFYLRLQWATKTTIFPASWIPNVHEQVEEKTSLLMNPYNRILFCNKKKLKHAVT